MAWGRPQGVDDLVDKLRRNDTAKTMCLLTSRRFGSADVAAFTEALATNTTLTALLASGHMLRPDDAAAFGRALSRNTTLTTLCLGNSDFGDKGLALLVEGLKANCGLLQLDMEFKSITCGDALNELLSIHPTLQELKLGRNKLEDPAVQSLARGLAQSSALKRLDLSENKLCGPGAASIARALLGGSITPMCAPLPEGRDVNAAWTETEVGNVASTGVGAQPQKEEIGKDNTALGDGEQARGGPPPLEHLDLSCNPLGDEGGRDLFQAMSAGGCCPSLLRSLAVAEAGLAAGACIALGVAMCPRVPCEAKEGAGEGAGGLMLSMLDLSKNDLGVEGLMSLSESFGRGGGRGLENLKLAYCRVGDMGVAPLCAALRLDGYRGLKRLDLSGNGLSGKGAGCALSLAGVEEVRLFHNSVGDEGVPGVLEGVHANASLSTVDLGANGLSGEGLETLLKGLAGHPALHTLEVGANANDYRSEEAVKSSQTCNPGLDIAFRRGGEAMEDAGCGRVDPQLPFKFLGK